MGKIRNELWWRLGSLTPRALGRRGRPPCDWFMGPGWRSASFVSYQDQSQPYHVRIRGFGSYGR